MLLHSINYANFECDHTYEVEKVISSNHLQLISYSSEFTEHLYMWSSQIYLKNFYAMLTMFTGHVCCTDSMFVIDFTWQANFANVSRLIFGLLTEKYDFVGRLLKDGEEPTDYTDTEEEHGSSPEKSKDDWRPTLHPVNLLTISSFVSACKHLVNSLISFYCRF